MAETLAELVRRCRGGKSVRSLAREAGLSFTYLARIERGEWWNLTIDAAAKLAGAMKVQPRVVIEAALESRRVEQ